MGNRLFVGQGKLGLAGEERRDEVHCVVSRSSFARRPLSLPEALAPTLHRSQRCTAHNSCRWWIALMDEYDKGEEREELGCLRSERPKAHCRSRGLCSLGRRKSRAGQRNLARATLGFSPFRPSISFLRRASLSRRKEAIEMQVRYRRRSESETIKKQWRAVKVDKY